MPTTAFATMMGDRDQLLSGEDNWPIIGTAFPEDKILLILQSLAGLNRYWDCINKATIARDILNDGVVVVGGLMAISGDLQSSYGYYFNPPFEFHAWLECKNGVIVDPALPGVIEKGLNTSDHIGPCIIGREPCVLNGPPLEWMQYKRVEIYHG
jgi:hypothetical protein